MAGQCAGAGNLVRRLAALSSQDVIDADAIDATLAQISPLTPLSNETEKETLEQAVERCLKLYFQSFGTALPPDGLYGRVLAEVERLLPSLAMEAAGHNQLRTARLVGLNRNTLRSKLNRQSVS